MPRKIIYALIVATILIVGSLVFYKNRPSIVYQLEPYPYGCVWRDGEAQRPNIQIGLVGPFQQKKIKRSQEAAFIKDASAKKECWFRQ